MQVLKKCWDQFEETILVYSYLLVVPLLFMQVICRYVFNNSLTWSEELARYIFIWQVWLGSSYCVQKNRHIRIDIFTHHLPRKAYQIFGTVITIISIVFCVFLIVKGGSVVVMIARLHQTSPAMKIPMQFIYACVPVSCALMIVRYIEHLFKLFRGASTNEQTEV